MTPTPRHPDHATAIDHAAVAGSPPPTRPKVQEALDARDALAYALSQAGLQLPAMDVRTPWADDREGEVRYALVHLGVCSAPVALMLADVILKGIGA
ncbi:hypothetical protein QFZ66_002502 [Streptomyces sp. B4I13]|uniref:hypothetical protein n=1 Tax=Streptomyces sp. B4I13 TaxID=3042271 RepID=UPI002789E0EE|nr:hypothetical protein [Streptomyces sp. B4I13]MDQ0958624.1 hypothetical protein [Streptomyces sp. B4I13]